MIYKSTKTYGTDRGLSCCFRQWRATHSHCSNFHGYSIGIKLTFRSTTLDSRQWVFDFGGLKPFKDWADYMWDHTVLVDRQDPMLEQIKAFASLSTTNAPYDTEHNKFFSTDKPHTVGGLVNLRIVDGIGCEKFSEMCFIKMQQLLDEAKLNSSLTRYPVGADVELESVEVFEHGANSAIYSR